VFPLLEPQIHVIVEGSPFGREWRHAVGTPLADPGGDLAPASHRVKRHRRPLDREQVREFGDVRDPVAPVPADLPAEDDAPVAAPGRKATE